MRIVAFLASLLATVAITVVLNSRMVLPAPLASLLSPQHGVWQNAEPANADFNETLSLTGLKGNADVYFDDRLVPHVFADNDEDAFFIQGYLHAKFRLWQMEFQTHAAGGRLCEILGDKLGQTDLLNKADRYFRRLGMRYAAEIALVVAEADVPTKNMMDAYTAGINSYIATLTQSNMPIEYKLLGYQPEPWSNFKSALFLKYMAFDLAGHENDFEFTSARNILSQLDYETLNPLRPDSLDPIIPAMDAALKAAPGFTPVKPAGADSLYFTYKNGADSLPREPQKPDRDNGSNNWAVSGSKTKSGYPILCNDPHLGLNLPSLWYEIHMQTPNFNVYGASFPCAPAVAIGFNDSCAFGFTNAGRDVRDYYEIKFKDATHKEYWFNNAWKATEFRYETIKIKNKPDYIDTVAYTVFGPVMFDETYQSVGKDGKCYAVRWKAHDPSNEIKLFYLLNRAKNYADYSEAIKSLETPGQNCVFATKSGDIALWCQGSFPAKWRRQGDFIMPGTDSSYMWQGTIPQAENPHQYNPQRGFVSSANQLPVDTTYPYYIGGGFPNYRGWTINKRLSAMQNITPQDMMQLQTDNYNVFAEMARPVMLRNINEADLSEEDRPYFDMLKQWNLRNDPAEKGASIFVTYWDSVEAEIWNDDIAAMHSAYYPHESTLVEALIKDTAFKYIDNINTPKKETLADILLIAFQKCTPAFKKAAAENKLTWAQFKDTRITHLTKLDDFSRLHLNIGGGTHIINATKPTHGPSWRMVVQLSPQTEAYGVYPGGQNGNPGSKYYDTFVDSWVTAKYYPLWVMKKTEATDKRIVGKISFTKG